MTASRVSLVAALLLAAATTASAGPAAGKKPPDKTDPGEAAYREGRRHYDLREWDEAIESFKESYRIKGDERSLFNIAQAYRLKGDCVSALGFYQTYKRNFPDADGIAAVDKLLGDVEACAKKAKQTQQKPPVEPAETHAPSPVDHEHDRDHVEVHADPVTADPTDGDGEGSAHVERGHGRDVDRPEATPAGHGRALRITGIALGAVGIGGLVGGGLLALHAHSISDQVSNGSGTFDMQLQQDGQAASRNATLCFIGGGVFVAGGVVLYMLGRPSETLAHVSFAPSARGGAFAWRGSF